MTEVGAEEIAEARADLEEQILPDTGTILALSGASDGEGGETEEWSPIATTPCRLDPYGGPTSSRGAGGEGQGHAGERIDSRTSHIVTMPANTAVSVENRIEINETTYEVNVLRRFGDWELTRRVEVRESF